VVVRSRVGERRVASAVLFGGLCAPAAPGFQGLGPGRLAPPSHERSGVGRQLALGRSLCASVQAAIGVGWRSDGRDWGQWVDLETPVCELGSPDCRSSGGLVGLHRGLRGDSARWPLVTTLIGSMAAAVGAPAGVEAAMGRNWKRLACAADFPAGGCCGGLLCACGWKWIGGMWLGGGAVCGRSIRPEVEGSALERFRKPLAHGLQRVCCMSQGLSWRPHGRVSSSVRERGCGRAGPGHFGGPGPAQRSDGV